MGKRPINQSGDASKEKRRILFVHNSADFYGASRSLGRLLDVLNRTEFEPYVILPTSGPLQARLEEMNIPVTIEPSLAIVSRYESLAKVLFWRLPLSVSRLLGFIRRNRIDLVHTNSGVIVSSPVAAKMAGIPHIWHVRESFEDFSGWRWNLYSKFMRHWSRHILCVSNATAAQFANRSNVEVIHNGFSLAEFVVDRAELGTDLRAKFNIPSDMIVVGCVGRIKLRRKGQEFLVQAAQLLKRQGIIGRFLIIGSAYAGNESHVDELQRLARELQVEKEIIFVGELSDPKPAYAAMDIFVLPSAQPEPFGGVVMEAMSMSLPVIATNIGGSLDQVAEGETGFLVPPASAEQLADKIACLALDREMRNRMGKAGRERIRSNFTLEKMTRQIEKIYRDNLQP